MSKLPAIQRRLESGGRINDNEIPSDEELQRQLLAAGNSFAYPETDPDRLYKRIQSLLAQPRPELAPSSLKLDPAITVPLMITVQRAETMPFDLRNQLQWSLLRSTDFGMQNPGALVFYGTKSMPDGGVKVQIIDRVAQEFEAERKSVLQIPRRAAGSAGRPGFAAQAWERIRASETYRRWYPTYKKLGTLYTLYLCVILIPTPLPTGDGPFAVFLEVMRRGIQLLLAYYSAPLVFLFRFFMHYRIVRRRALHLNPYMAIRP